VRKILTLTLSLLCLLAGATLAVAAAPEAKVAPANAGPQPPAVFPDATVTEGFEGNLVPPAGWTLDTTNAAYPWEIATIGTAHGGTYFANVEYDPALVPQLEALYSPLLVRPITLSVSFWSQGSVYWCRDDYDNCDLDIYLDEDNIFGNGNETLVHTADALWPGNWTWTNSVLDLTAQVAGEDRYVAFVYQGVDGAQVGLDDIVIDYEEGVVPVQVSVLEIPTLGLAGLVGLGLLLAAAAAFVLSRRG